MTNPLMEKVEKEFKRLGFQGAELIRQSYSAESFGDAQAIYKIGNLYLNFVRNRSEDSIDFINPADMNDLYTFADMSLVMGWKTLEKMMEELEKARDFTEPPTGPIPLGDAIGLIKQHYGQLQNMFSLLELDNTLNRLKEACRKRCKAFLGWEPKL